MTEQSMTDIAKPAKVKVGPKGRVAVVPDGWHEVTQGITQPGDMFASTVTGEFQLTDEFDAGSPAYAYDCLIRKTV